MGRLALIVSVAWGAFLAFVLVGASIDRSIGLIAYLSCALAVWLFLFVVARRHGSAGTALALKAIPVSLLGPVALVLPGIRALRRRRVDWRPTEAGAGAASPGATGRRARAAAAGQRQSYPSATSAPA